MERVEVDIFIDSEKISPIIDVRSPSEFIKGHIPGALNIPIFDDLERAKVGTVYKQQSREEAIALGLEIVGPKMANFAARAKEIAGDGNLHLYCWRGGMRSEKMAWLFELVGVETKVLQDGYKAYRKFLHQQFKLFKKLVVLQGPTGSGKTEILLALRDLGEQVLDLEGLANHKGSAFGGLGEDEQPTTQQFQNNILAAMADFDLAKTTWIESESSTIGRVYLPEELWLQMNQATVLAIEVPRASRIEHIVEQYGAFSAKELVGKIEQLQENLGGAQVKSIIKLVEDGNLYDAVDLLLKYYDKSYGYSATKFKTKKPITIKLSTANRNESARILIDKLDEITL